LWQKQVGALCGKLRGERAGKGLEKGWKRAGKGLEKCCKKGDQQSARLAASPPQHR